MLGLLLGSKSAKIPSSSDFLDGDKDNLVVSLPTFLKNNLTRLLQSLYPLVLKYML